MSLSVCVTSNWELIDYNHLLQMQTDCKKCSTFCFFVFGFTPVCCRVVLCLICVHLLYRTGTVTYAQVSSDLLLRLCRSDHLFHLCGLHACDRVAWCGLGPALCRLHHDLHPALWDRILSFFKFRVFRIVVGRTSWLAGWLAGWAELTD